MPALREDERWTADMVRALPDDGNRYEVVDGVLLVSPSPQRNHQRAVANLLMRLFPFAKEHGIGEAMMSPADIEFSPQRMVQPDVFVIPHSRGKRTNEWADVRDLSLAIEVLSPSTARADRFVKRRMFQDQGVPEYWIVDLDARLIERWRPGDERGESCDTTIAWQPVTGGPSLTIDLVEFFREVLPDE